MSHRDLGRPLATLEAPWQGDNREYCSVQLDAFGDRTPIEGANFRHCTFTDVSFLNADLSESTFLNWRFVRCYFRGATATRSAFVGCRFEDCRFDKIALRKCDFRFSKFYQSAIGYEQLFDCLPPEPNLREELCSSLMNAARTSGAQSDVRSYRIAAIDARGSHLKLATLGGDSWYREHYAGSRRLEAASEWIWYLTNRFVWRHGESPSRLLVLGLLLSTLVFPTLFVFVGSGPENWLDSLGLSLASFIPFVAYNPPDDIGVGAMIVAGVETVVGLVFSGLLLTTVIRKLARE